MIMATPPKPIAQVASTPVVAHVAAAPNIQLAAHLAIPAAGLQAVLNNKNVGLQVVQPKSGGGTSTYLFLNSGSNVAQQITKAAGTKGTISIMNFPKIPGLKVR